jgi:hypothetical protein
MAKIPTLTEAQKKKKFKGLCITAFCMKPHGKRSNYCYSCAQKRYQAAHPLEFTYNTWIQNCKRRKKVNTVTLKQFKVFVTGNDYMKKKGTGAKMLQIDRLYECRPECPKEWCYEHGYHDYNIQAITLRENRYKYDQHKRDYSQVPF